MHKLYGIPILNISDQVKDIARQRNEKQTRKNLQNIVKQYFQKYGKFYFSDRTVSEIKKRKWEICAVSGIRSIQNINSFRKAFGKNFTLIHVNVTDSHVRFERVKKRGSQKDPSNFNQFLEQDKKEEAIFNFNEAISKADITIQNNQSISHLEKKVKQFFENKIKDSF